MYMPCVQLLFGKSNFKVPMIYIKLFDRFRNLLPGNVEEDYKIKCSLLTLNV